MAPQINALIGLPALALIGLNPLRAFDPDRVREHGADGATIPLLLYEAARTQVPSRQGSKSLISGPCGPLLTPLAAAGAGGSLPSSLPRRED